MTIEARTTSVARVECATVAGPNVENSLSLFVSYFPGDGEAVLRTEIDFGNLLVKKVTSALGVATLYSDQIELDYRRRPLSEAVHDTVGLIIFPTMLGRNPLSIRTFSSLRGVESPAHEADLTLTVSRPIPVEIEYEPRTVYPNQRFDLKLRLKNTDPQGRTVTTLDWLWPEFVRVTSRVPENDLKKPLKPGESLERVYNLEVNATRSDFGIDIVGRASSPDIVGSPLPKIHLNLFPVPVVSARFAQGRAEKGGNNQLHVSWHNETGVPIPLHTLRTRLPATFQSLSIFDVSSEHANAVIETKVVEGKTISEVVVRLQSGELAPDQTLRVTVSVTPSRSGLFVCESKFQPLESDVPVKLPGEMILGVVEAQQADDHELEIPTDLEAVQAALAGKIDEVLSDFPVGAGSPIKLRAEKKDAKNWIVEHLLTETLIRKGYTVVVQPVSEEYAHLNYRLVDARVVYAPTKGWNPIVAEERREVVGDVFLSLQDAKSRLTWIRRISGYEVETLAVENSQWLRGSGSVGRATVDPGNKAVEIGLSSVILGGLFFIFFVP